VPTDILPLVYLFRETIVRIREHGEGTGPEKLEINRWRVVS
jgi:hypothetical protein